LAENVTITADFEGTEKEVFTKAIEKLNESFLQETPSYG